MAAKTLFSIEGTISVEFLPAERALIGHWESLCSPRFRALVLGQVAPYGISPSEFEKLF